MITILYHWFKKPITFFYKKEKRKKETNYFFFFFFLIYVNAIRSQILN